MSKQVKSAIQRRFASPETAIPSGASSIVVALAVGGAVIVALLMIWQARDEQEKKSAQSRTEEEARGELRAARSLLEGGEWAEAAQKGSETEKRLAAMDGDGRAGFKELRIVADGIQGEAKLRMGGPANLAAAEEDFSAALSALDDQGGILLESALFGRARARCGLGKFREAEEDLSRLIAFNGNYGAAYVWRAAARRKLDKAEDAERDAEKGRALASWIETPGKTETAF